MNQIGKPCDQPCFDPHCVLHGALGQRAIAETATTMAVRALEPIAKAAEILRLVRGQAAGILLFHESLSAVAVSALQSLAASVGETFPFEDDAEGQRILDKAFRTTLTNLFCRIVDGESHTHATGHVSAEEFKRMERALRFMLEVWTDEMPKLLERAKRFEHDRNVSASRVN